MKLSTFALLACPTCHGELERYSVDPQADPCLTGNLYCNACSTNYSILEGIPHFFQSETLRGLNQRFSHAYDWFSLGYHTLSKVAFATIGLDEQSARREITDRLEPDGGRILEVSIGPGVNLPGLLGRQDVGEVFGLDISQGQLKRCQNFLRKHGWGVDLFLGKAGQLPFRENSFDTVFHVGGMNHFKDQKSAIAEMIRVAKPGGQILIADETEHGALNYEKFMPGFTDLFGGTRTEIIPPLALVPPEMQELHVQDVWKGWLYCIEFRKA